MTHAAPSLHPSIHSPPDPNAAVAAAAAHFNLDGFDQPEQHASASLEALKATQQAMEEEAKQAAERRRAQTAPNAMMEDLVKMARSSPPEMLGPNKPPNGMMTYAPRCAVTLQLSCPSASQPRVGRLRVTVSSWQASVRVVGPGRTHCYRPTSLSAAAAAGKMARRTLLQSDSFAMTRQDRKHFLE